MIVHFGENYCKLQALNTYMHQFQIREGRTQRCKTIYPERRIFLQTNQYITNNKI
ncbi:unnamed protein product [Paramecium octaurelia]|uniref:Uncharacterized protein n=1 Tax=Paramecium octaurelia TaxID=43137 RepID=A0A8S1T2C8_PAROT|nr:unnamed protein product [Paramecium octaurelia]